MSKFGSKHAAIALNQARFLTNYGEQTTFKEDDLHLAEEYLVILKTIVNAIVSMTMLCILIKHFKKIEYVFIFSVIGMCIIMILDNVFGYIHLNLILSLD